jgi:hypothetical protein
VIVVKNRGAWGTQVEDNERGEGAWKARMCAVVPSMCGRLETIISSSSLGQDVGRIYCMYLETIITVCKVSKGMQ